MDYFALLELPKDFALDEDALHRAYIQKQREFHPDRLGKSSQEERARSMHMSVEVNQGYHVLKSPLLRAEYLLKLAGAEEQPPSQALLMESMEAREEVMDAQTPEVLSELEEKHRASLAQEYDAFAQHYSGAKLEEAAASALRLRYLHKLLDEIRVRCKLLAGRKENI